ncbi:hypothetical protein [Actinoplanes regularis]|nr:hypothetical protein [Actinoplanes regularis]
MMVPPVVPDVWYHLSVDAPAKGNNTGAYREMEHLRERVRRQAGHQIAEIERLAADP